MQQMEFRVRPVAGGWMVQSDAIAPLVFRSGGDAERKAQDLARAVSASGADARVVVLDRSEQVVGTKRYWAEESPSRPAVTRRLQPAVV